MYPKYNLKARKPAELLLVPMIDIFTVLVTFLLMTAVFSRLAIVQLDLPSAAASRPSEPTFRLEVIVRKDGLELTDGRAAIASLPKVNGEYDLAALSKAALALKREHPQAENASVLLEPAVPYDALIQVTDAIRSTTVPIAEAGSQATATPATVADATHSPAGGQVAGGPQTTRLDLFPKIAVGDAP